MAMKKDQPKMAAKESEASASKLRLYESGLGWVNYGDKIGDDGKVQIKGSKEKFDGTLINALNATNVVVLAGSGTSLCSLD